MKLWVDDVIPAPEGYYVWCKSINEAIDKLSDLINFGIDDIEVIDIGYDADLYACDSNDYLRLLGWLEEIGRNYPIHIHSQNPVGVENIVPSNTKEDIE